MSHKPISATAGVTFPFYLIPKVLLVALTLQLVVFAVWGVYTEGLLAANAVLLLATEPCLN
jgi:hypothetical protein